ncbi:hypothetical protein CDL12_22914 [Handroanthus impetiginosus]|uniref:F-box associated domain-containing protein n=1 Tax=Handroanthus impetiginosus TaxID=429701 RepID=A0A2G9GGX7_9LAMI|nr:hypothetical protein CDL12_22914 [Handroanthus impetiginosus]
MSCGYIIRDGFGFDPGSGDYKVYAALYSEHPAIAKTYSLKTNRRWYISSLDLKNEVYGMVEQPKVFEFDPDPTLGVLDGCLSLFYHYSDHENRDLWVLKQYEMKDSWSKLFTLRDLFVYNPRKNCIWYPKMIGFNILGEVDVYVESLVSINVANVE